MTYFYKFFKIINILIGGSGVFLAIILSEQRYAIKKCQKVHVLLKPSSDQQFITEEKILDLITESGRRPILNRLIKNIKTSTMINKLQNDFFVKNVVVYKRWQGVLEIIVVPKKAVARIIGQDSSDQYIDEEGNYIPTSSHYTVRVLLVEVDASASVLGKRKDYMINRRLLELLRCIREDVFLKSQIVHIRVDKNDKIIMYPRIGKQIIEFGKLECIVQKCTKLKYFYDAIIPYKGWDAYSRVNLEFDNQIICE